MAEAKRPIHKWGGVALTACGINVGAPLVTGTWAEVTCLRCLKKRPEKKRAR